MKPFCVSRYGGLRNWSPWLERLFPLAAFFYVLTSSYIALGGGLYILEESLAFDHVLHKTRLEANKIIVMDFMYEHPFTYGGKPFSYIIFTLYKGRVHREHKQEPISYFLAPFDPLKPNGRAQFHLPEANTDYEIRVHSLPYFSDQPLPIYGGPLPLELVERIKRFYRKPENSDLEYHLVFLTAVSSESSSLPESFALYFSKPQDIFTDIEAGRPPTFEWFPGSETSSLVRDIEYSYRLDPLEEWTIFSKSKKATYNFLRPGNYDFQVKARYTLQGIRQESAIANLSISVKKLIFSPHPTMISSSSNPISPEFWQRQHFKTSRALLIGVKENKDPAFLLLPYVDRDIALLKEVLRLHKFQVETLEEETTKDKIVHKMETLLTTAEEGDRIILYYSGHGTAINGESPYLVPSDCHPNQPTTCISFQYIDDWINRVMREKKVQHLLVISDACQSGLGLLSKSFVNSSIEELDKYPSAHMMTAGLMEQKAQMDLGLGSSVFTHQLVRGLKSEADLDGDNVITLSELLVFVQREVANWVEKNYNRGGDDKDKIKQTPVMGGRTI